MKEHISFTKILSIAIAVCLVVSLSIIGATFDKDLILAEILIGVALVILAVGCIFVAKKIINSYFQTAARHISDADDSAMNRFGIAMMIVNQGDEIVWYNDKFRSSVLRGIDAYSSNISVIFGDSKREDLEREEFFKIEYKEKFFSVFALNCSDKYEGQTIYFFYDDTDFCHLQSKYESSRPCVFFIHIDGLDLLLKNTPESKKNEILGSIERNIEELDKDSKGYIQKISSDKYFLLVEKTSFDEIRRNKFEVLSKVRKLDFGERGFATLSIGVGVNGENLSECVEFANSALEMALGRGGDQAVIKNDEDFEFFGGVSESKPVNTAVRTRLVSQTLQKLIMSSENILIMGHGFSDMDAYGASYGLYCAISKIPHHL